MAFVEFNKNPKGKKVGDCVIRAISTALHQDWDSTYIGIMLEGFTLKDMPSANNVWGEYLKKAGYERRVVPSTCTYCYTIRDFCEDHQEGRYIVATGSHVVAVIEGNYLDTWDSGDEIPVYYWEATHGIQ